MNNHLAVYYYARAANNGHPQAWKYFDGENADSAERSPVNTIS